MADQGKTVQGSADTYEVIRDSDGQLREVVRAGDRLRVPIDVENQDFCDFLTWASHQRPRVDLQPFAGLGDSLLDRRHGLHLRNKGSLAAAARNE